MDILCDIDGTVANLEHRRHWVLNKPKNWRAFNANIHLDTPISHVISVIQALDCLGHTIIFCSGRENVFREVTEKWIAKHVIRPKHLYMRPEKDYRPDNIVKYELLQKIREDGFNPTMVFDDRKQVVDMWIENGIHVFDVSQGKGDF